MKRTRSAPGRHTGGVRWVDPGEKDRRSPGQASAGNLKPMDEQDALDILRRTLLPGWRAVGSEEHSVPRRPLISRKQPRRHQQRAQLRPRHPCFAQDSLCSAPAQAAIDELARLTAQGKDHAPCWHGQHGKSQSAWECVCPALVLTLPNV
jgi:hypothetical protein